MWAGTLAYYTYVGEHRDAFYVLFREMGDPGGELARQRRRLRSRVVVSIDAILSPGTGPGAQAELLERLAEAHLGSARALANWWLDHPEVSAKAITEQVMNFTLTGLEAFRNEDAEPQNPV
jgi:hypothetical protein